MRLWIDVYDSSWNRVGDGPVITVTDASVTRLLDGPGTIRFDAMLTDKRAMTLLTNEARVILFQNVDGVTREMGRGIIRGRRFREGRSKSLTFEAVDDLDELKRKNTGLARIYSNLSVSSIVSDLTGLVAGWTATTTGGATLTSMRFDGASVLKALQEITKQQGLHLRRGTGNRQVEVGAFGTDSGVRLTTPNQYHADQEDDTGIAWIESIEIEQDSEQVANWIVPLGQGEGESALSLRYSTRTSPYTIQTTTINGRTHYYIADSASVSTFGQIERVATFKQIGAVSNTDADLQNASNALYDAAAAWLQRNAVRLDSYRVIVRKCRTTIRPGDKVRVSYKGIVTRMGEPFTYIDVESDFWVMEVREEWGAGGPDVALVLASVDRVAMDAAEIVVGALEEIEIRNLRVQTYPSVRSFVYRREVANGFPAIMPVVLTETTTQLNRAKVRVTSRPFRSTAAGGAAGGNHDHRITAHGYYGALGAALPGGAALYQVSFLEEDGTNMTLYVPAIAVTDTHSKTFTTSGTHTHPQVYGISDDSSTPVSISVFVDGVNRTSALGGPWAGAGGTVTFEIDITQYLVNAVGGLRSAHTLEFRCASGQGEIEITVELYETIQAIAVT
jgi:hypothetical protein